MTFSRNFLFVKSGILVIMIFNLGCIKKTQVESHSGVGNEIQLNDGKEELKDKIIGLDTVEAIGCSTGYYALISEKCVLKIPASINRQSVVINNSKYEADRNDLEFELFVFDKGDAHLANLCSDIIISNYPKPNRILKTTNTHISIYPQGNSDFDDLTIKLNEIIFIDDNNDVIIIGNKVMLKVSYIGVPG